MERTPRPIRVATYNIRKCIGLDRRRQPDRTLDVIAGLGADVVALQEADRRLGARPATLDRRKIVRDTDLDVVDVAPNDVSLGWHGNAVLVRKDIRVDAVKRLVLPGLEPRGAVLVELAPPSGPIRLVAVHLGLTRAMRRAQLERIARIVARRPEMPTLMLGDFNEWSPDIGLEPLAPDYEVLAPGRSYHAARPVAALDRIAFNSGLALQDAGVVRTKTAKRASDHLPVWADLSRS